MEVEYVILVNNNDQSLGAMEKMEAHEKGVMHRAISVFVFNNAGEMLLQKRADEKYHSAGLWSNTACSHPRTNEKPRDAAHRRLIEEMGFDCDIDEAFSFVYKANVGESLTEHEYDHVFIGYCDVEPTPNPDEVGDWKYVDFDWLIKDIDENPDDYTVWFKIALEEVKKHFKKA